MVNNIKNRTTNGVKDVTDVGEKSAKVQAPVDPQIGKMPVDYCCDP